MLRCPTSPQLKQVVLEHPAARWPDVPQLRHICACPSHIFIITLCLPMSCQMPFSHPGCDCQCPRLHPRTLPFWLSLVMMAASAMSWGAKKIFTYVVSSSYVPFSSLVSLQISCPWLSWLHKSPPILLC